MKTCKTPKCKIKIEDKFQYCRGCAARRVTMFKSRWRKRHKIYHRNYLRDWRLKQKKEDAETRKKFFENPIPFLLKKAVAESEYLEQLRQGAQ